MKITALHETHVKLKAKMVEFAGYDMPIEYSGIKDEHLTVRNNVGVFDVSHMGEFWVSGPNALKLLRKVSSNDPTVLNPGQAQYTCFPNGKGGIVDDLIIYCFDHQRYLLVVNAGNIQKDWEWVNINNTVNATIDNVSEEYSQLAVQGPLATKTLQKITKVNLAEIKFYNFVIGEIGGIDDVIISATGYTGAGGFELYCKNSNVDDLWNAVFDSGAEYGIKPIGLGARDTLRLEMGYCLYGNDIDDTTSPIEAGLGWITRFNNDRKFIDREFLTMQKNEGVKRKLRGFVLLEKGIPRHGYELSNSNGDKIGEVTSGTMSPIIEKGIGLGYISREYTATGTVINVKIRNKLIPAEIVKLPFI
ncbi:MAG TPA: glycine cleavage system aminomethyltransferase GcvT [Mariniphaga sp.]|nr:glycine cleavage system aminomethyltransferase GcvT [Mariniphaga sp.]